MNMPPSNNVFAIFAVMLTATAPAFVVAQECTENCIELTRSDSTTLPIPLNPSQPVQISPLTGVISATTTEVFSCASDVGCEGVDVSLSPTQGGFFTVNGGSSASVPQTGSVTFDWFARGGWSCEATGLQGTTWPGPGKSARGPLSVSVSGLEPGVAHTAGLSCNNGPASAIAADVTINVEASELQIPMECQGRQPGNAQATKICESNGFNNPNTAINCFDYASLFGAIFPGSTGSGRDFFTNENEFVALKFNTETLTLSSGRWSRVPPQIAPTATGPKIMTISKCPGDFDQDLIAQEMQDPDCYVKTQSVLKESVRWHRAGTTDPGGSCELPAGAQDGGDFFLNIFYTNDSAGTAPSDLQWGCGTFESATSCADNFAPSAN